MELDLTWVEFSHWQNRECQWCKDLGVPPMEALWRRILVEKCACPHTDLVCNPHKEQGEREDMGQIWLCPDCGQDWMLMGHTRIR